MRLLDDLLGGDICLANVEQWFFGGDRVRMLCSLSKLRADGCIEIRANDIDVPDWQLAAWARAPEEEVARAGIECMDVSITQRGIELWYPAR